MIQGSKILSVICDGEIQLCLLTNEDIEGAMEVLRRAFFINENLCIATGVNKPENKASVEELTQLAKSIIKDGVSIVAKHVPTGIVAGVALNKIHKTCQDINESAQEAFLGDFVENTCKTDSVKCITDYLSAIERKFDIFTEWNINCVVEHFMLATLPEFGKRNIGYNLCLQSIELAIELGQNELSLYRDFMPKHLRECKPKAIYAIFTSTFSHKIGKRLGFQDLIKVPFTEFTYKGVKFSDILDPIHQYCILGARKF